MRATVLHSILALSLLRPALTYKNYGTEWLAWASHEAQQLLPQETSAGHRVRRTEPPGGLSDKKIDAPVSQLAETDVRARAAPLAWPGVGGAGPRGGVELGPLRRPPAQPLPSASKTDHVMDRAVRLAPFLAARIVADANFDAKRDEREARIFNPGTKMKREAYHLRDEHIRGNFWTLFGPTYPCLFTLAKYPARGGGNTVRETSEARSTPPRHFPKRLAGRLALLILLLSRTGRRQVVVRLVRSGDGGGAGWAAVRRLLLRPRRRRVRLQALRSALLPRCGSVKASSRTLNRACRLNALPGTLSVR